MPHRILRLPDVMDRVGLRKSAIYSRIASGEFPAPIPLGARAVGWLETEVDEWLNARIDAARVERREPHALGSKYIRRGSGR